jgi:acetyl esterase/lipase
VSSISDHVANDLAITYRLAPEHVFPLPLHDVLHGYLRLLAPPLSIPPENIIIAGDSAGGGLSLALVMYLRDEGYKMPAGIVLMSPWVDLTMSCGSWDDNLEWDVVPRPEADGESS